MATIRIRIEMDIDLSDADPILECPQGAAALQQRVERVVKHYNTPELSRVHVEVGVPWRRWSWVDVLRCSVTDRLATSLVAPVMPTRREMELARAPKHLIEAATCSKLLLTFISTHKKLMVGALTTAAAWFFRVIPYVAPLWYKVKLYLWLLFSLILLTTDILVFGNELLQVLSKMSDPNMIVYTMSEIFERVVTVLYFTTFLPRLLLLIGTLAWMFLLCEPRRRRTKEPALSRESIVPLKSTLQFGCMILKPSIP